jgi:hypothetical protein
MLSAGCVHPGASGVKVAPVKAELVFGVKDTTKSAPTPIDVAFSTDENLVDSGPSRPAFQPFRPNNSFQIPLYIGDNAGDDFVIEGCPDKIVKPLPRRNAAADVDGDPPIGKIPFSGSQTIYRQTDTVSRQLDPEDRVYRNLKKSPDKNNKIFTYEIVQPYGKDFLVSLIQVNPNSTAETVRPTTEPAIESQRYRSDPESGVVLKRTDIVDAKGNAVPGTKPFVPSTGLLLLPIPVSSEDYTSSAVDPSTGRTLVLQASVKARERVNACGEPAEGWLVQAFYTVADGNTEKDYRWNYVIAPQYGGIIISEDVNSLERRQKNAQSPPEFQVVEKVVRSLMTVQPT